jgi:hypothetical protein
LHDATLILQFALQNKSIFLTAALRLERRQNDFAVLFRDEKMKRLRTFALLGVSALVLLSCAKGPDLRNPQHFRTKTGVIGVFRQPAFYCSEANPHFMQLGPDSAVQVKPTWSEDQDNLFVTEQPAGKAVLRSYSYSCGGRDNKFVLDSTTPGPIGVVVPEKGFV